jgi:hypothetical protein
MKHFLSGAACMALLVAIIDTPPTFISEQESALPFAGEYWPPDYDHGFDAGMVAGIYEQATQRAPIPPKTPCEKIKSHVSCEIEAIILQ